MLTPGRVGAHQFHAARVGLTESAETLAEARLLLLRRLAGLVEVCRIAATSSLSILWLGLEA